MSTKKSLIIGEGISHKNILPNFGKNYAPQLQMENDLRKFMSNSKAVLEASGGSTLADANGNNVTGGGEAGPAAMEAAGASGVTDPVTRAVGQQAMDLAARASTGDNKPSSNQAMESLVQAFVNDLVERAESEPYYNEEGEMAWYKPNRDAVSEALMGTETPEDRGREYRKSAAKSIRQARKQERKDNDINGAFNHLGRDVLIDVGMAAEASKSDPEFSELALNRAIHIGNARNKIFRASLRKDK